MFMLSTHYVLCLAVNKNIPGSEILTHQMEGITFYEVRFDRKYTDRILELAKPFSTYIEMKERGKNNENTRPRGQFFSCMYFNEDEDITTMFGESKK